MRQLTSPVRFTGSVQSSLSDVDAGVEVGPGAVLAGLVRRVRKELPVRTTENKEAMEEAIGWALGS
jgi:malonyl CoA-acyl carrier protein transacylase